MYVDTSTLTGIPNYNKYREGVDYYSRSGSSPNYTYTKLIAGTDYTIGNTISGSRYYLFNYDTIYIDAKEFPYTPPHDAGQNDLDYDAYTNTKGYTIRNRVRHDVKTLDFSIETMTGEELHNLLLLRDATWFQCTFFDEKEWTMITKKMYCSSPTYHKEYIDKENPNNNIYTNITFGFVEQ